MSETPETPETPVTSISFTRNPDGSVTARLSSPITVDGLEVSRLTIPALKGKHLKRCPFVPGGTTTLGQLIEYASIIVLPLGSVDELAPMDAVAIAGEVGTQLQAK